MKTIKILAYSFLMVSLYSCNSNAQTKKISTEPAANKAVAVFAEGCFWCSEHVFETVVGVESVVSGYTGGSTKNPTYGQVGSNSTGHAEAILVTYDPKIVSFKELVTVFFASQDPTTPNQQGPDVGSSYRSIAFYKNENEKVIIKNKIKELTYKYVFRKPIVTEILPVSDFYQAEDYHQDYVKLHPNNSYVENVSIPRYELFKQTYKGKLKSK